MAERGDEAAAAEGGEAGTTLVELVVAMALLSLIALFIGEGVSAVRSMAPVGARIAASAEAAAVRDHLRRTLSEAVARLPLGAAAPFSGNAASLRLVAPADPVLEIGGLAEIALALEPGAGGGLALVERRAVARAGAGEAGGATVLLDGVSALRFSYAPAGGGAAAGWSSAWEAGEGPGAPGLPGLVRVEIELPPGDPRRFPPLLVHPLAAGGIPVP